MTDLALPPHTHPANDAELPRVWPILVAGPLAGFLLGVLARIWMRVISDDPEFTWAGTIAIVAIFTIFGTAQSIAIATRRRARRRWTLTIARVVGVIGLLPLFIAAGSVMFPTVVGGGLALYRTDWNKVVRLVCIAVALLPVLLVTKDILGFGWSLQTVVGVAGFLAIYGLVIVAARSTLAPQQDGWRLPRWTKIGFLVLAVLPIVRLIAAGMFR